MGMLFHQVVIVGVGLIGGSLGLILKQQGLAGSVIGVGRRPENLKLAVQLGAIDRYVSCGVDAVREADLVILATPIDTYIPQLNEWASSLPSNAIVSDVGSVKGKLVEAVEELLHPRVRFVGAHPIAGREKSGVAYSTPDLFQGARCVVTPTTRTDPTALDTVRELWEAAGSRVLSMDPFDHDWVLGSVSHLPHVAAFALMHALQDLQTQLHASVDLLSYSGGGIRDTTRIAASSPEMWCDICLANRQNLISMIETYIQQLDRFKHFLEHNDHKSLEEALEQAKQARERMP